MRIAQVFGENLKRIRKQRGFTQTKICEDLQISVPTFIRWEKGENMPREEGQIDQLAEFLGINAEDLFSSKKNESPKPVKMSPKEIAAAVTELAAKGEIVIKWKPK